MEAKIVNINKKNRVINLSVKAKDFDEEKDAIREHQKSETENAAPATIGDLIKAQMESKDWSLVNVGAAVLPRLQN